MRVGSLPSLLWALLLVSGLAACASPTAAVLPARPRVPDGWVRFTSADREIAITVPPEITVRDDQSGITAGFYSPPPDLFSLGVLSMGPTVAMPQPTPPLTETGLADWLLPLVSGRRPETFTQSSVLLPVGPAVEVRFSFDVGTPDEVAIVAVAIPTSRGVAFLTAHCQAEPMSDCGEFLRLVPLLLELNLPRPS